MAATTALAWLALLFAGIVMIRRARRGRRLTIVLLAGVYLAVSSLALIAIEKRTETYYWTSDVFEPTSEGGARTPVPSAADLAAAFSFAHLGIAITLAGVSQLVRNWHRVLQALLCVLVPPFGECVVRLGTWLAMTQWMQEVQEPLLALGSVAVSFLLPGAIGGGAVFLVSGRRRRTGEQPITGRIVES